MKNVSKYILSIIYVIFIYLTMFFTFVKPFDANWIMYVITFLLGLSNVALAIIYGINKDKEALLSNGIILKCSTILAYITIFFIALGVAGILTIFIGFLSLISVVPAFILDALMLLVSSSYLISYLIVDLKENKSKINIFHGFLQFIFVADVIDTIVIACTTDKKYRLLSLSLLVLTIIILILLIIIGVCLLS